LKSLTLLLIYPFLAINLNSQKVCESNHLSIQAEIYYRQKTNLPKAIELYKSAFQLNLTDGSKALDAVNAATELNDTLSTIEFLSKCISLGISPQDVKNLWPHLGNSMNFDYLISNVDTLSILNQYNSNLDTFLISQLGRLAENDQKYRGQKDFEWKMQKSLDSLNWLELKKNVRQIGRLPRYKEIGLDGQENLEILFFHMNKEIIEWFLPYVIKCVNEDNSNLGRIILYQLDRIGMSEGIIYTIRKDMNIEIWSGRTKMKNGYYCQSFGEWFDEKSLIDNKFYETPIDPQIDLEEVNRIRNIFCMESIENKRMSKPWVNVVPISEFEIKVKE
jgi:tetratricopeptide (TPR) repeat protein